MLHYTTRYDIMHYTVAINKKRKHKYAPTAIIVLGKKSVHVYNNSFTKEAFFRPINSPAWHSYTRELYNGGALFWVFYFKHSECM